MRLLLVIQFLMFLGSCLGQQQILLTKDCPQCYTEPIDEKKILNRSTYGSLYSSAFNPDHFSEPSAIVTTESINCFNCTLAGLYKLAYFDKMKGPDDHYLLLEQSNREIWEGVDPILLRFRELLLVRFDNIPDSLSLAMTATHNDFLAKNTFCYTINVKGTNEVGKIHGMMLDDLNSFFEKTYGLTGEMKTIKVKCKALISISPSEKFKSKGGLEQLILYRPNAFSMKNTGLENFLETLSNTYFSGSPEPIINETNYHGTVDISLTGNLSDLTSVNSQLENYGLRLVEKEKEIKMIIIKTVDKK